MQMLMQYAGRIVVKSGRRRIAKGGRTVGIVRRIVVRKAGPWVKEGDSFSWAIVLAEYILGAYACIHEGIDDRRDFFLESFCCTFPIVSLNGILKGIALSSYTLN